MRTAATTTTIAIILSHQALSPFSFSLSPPSFLSSPVSFHDQDLQLGQRQRRLRQQQLLQQQKQQREDTKMCSNNNNNNNEDEDEDDRHHRPTFSMGLIADIQYAPIPDGYSYTGNPRYYQHSLDVATHAFQHFQTARVDLVTNLGDTIDGKCQDIAKHGGQWPPLPSETVPSTTTTTEESQQQLRDNFKMDSENDRDSANTQQKNTILVDPGLHSLGHVMDAISSYKHGPVLHSYGNHCLYNLDRSQLQDHLGVPFVREQHQHYSKSNERLENHELVGYYTHKVKRRRDTTTTATAVDTGIRLVFIDAYDVAMMQRCDKTSHKYQHAVDILRANNYDNYNDGNINSPEGLDGLQKRFVAFNGAIGSAQLKWIRSTLHNARHNNERVIIMSHNPIHPESSNPVCLIWNYNEVLDVLREYADVVVASFAGHAHKGGYCRDEVSGIHFRVVEAALENKPDKTYAIMDVYHNDDDNNDTRPQQQQQPQSKLVIRGFGNCESAVYDFDHTYKAAEALRRRKQSSMEEDNNDAVNYNNNNNSNSSSEAEEPLIVWQEAHNGFVGGTISDDS